MALSPAGASGQCPNPPTDAAETKRYVGPALHGVMEPGERIVAGACAMTGWRWRELCVAIGLSGWAVLTVPVLGHLSPVGILLLGLAPILLVPFYVLDTTRRRVFIAITDRQLICISLRRLLAGRVRFHVPIGSFHIRRTVSRGRYRSLTYVGPGAPVSGLRVTATGKSRRDMNDVVSALQAAGVLVDGFVPAFIAELGSSY
ncbi:MAG TPA: hypothetical protein VEL03_17645 [Streptosporangiaceae bacterium]|nr:hypothetical protein [Streptosporangiaceae bacterium]